MPPTTIRTISTVCAVFAALITFVMLLTKPFTTRNPAHVFGMDVCGGRACFRSLVPGETTWEDARALFNGRTVISIDGPDGAIRLFATADGERLGYIHITVPDESLSLGSVILLYGRPCAVTVYPQSRKFTLHYPAVIFATPANQTALSPYTPIKTIEYVSSTLHDSSLSGICIEQRAPANMFASHFTWKGFGRLSWYTAWLPS